MNTTQHPLVTDGWYALCGELHGTPPLDSYFYGVAVAPGKGGLGGPVQLSWNEQGEAFHTNGVRARAYDWELNRAQDAVKKQEPARRT